MGKRAAPVVAKAVAKKTKKEVDPIEEHCTVVLDAIKGTGDYPEATCEMIRAMLRPCMAQVREERHEYEASFEVAVAKEMAKIEETYQNNIKTDEAVKKSLEEERQSVEAQITDLKNTLAEKEQMLLEKKYELAKEAKVFQPAKRALQEAQGQRDNCDGELAAIVHKKGELEDAFQGSFQALKEGTAGQGQATAESAKLVARVHKLLTLDESLVSTIPSALGKEPAARGPFDTITIQQLEETMSRQLRELAASISDADRVKAERTTKVDSVQQEFNAAQERQLKASDAFLAFQKEEEGTKDAIVEAKKKARKFPLMQQRAEKKLLDAQSRLDAFRQGPLAALAQLRDHKRPVEASEQKTPCDVDQSEGAVESTQVDAV